jgi:branched-chain amino acid aminotransferase
MATAGVVYLDGAYVSPDEARMSIFDWGYVYSDVVYDVTSVWNGWFFELEEHLDRFERSCAGFRLDPGRTRDEIRTILAECVSRAELDNAYVKLECSRGLAPIGSRDLRAAENRFTAYAVPYAWIWGEERCRNGSNVHVSRKYERVSSKAIDARFKNYARGDLVQARLDAYEAGCDDAVLIGPDGELTEGFGWNILLVKDGRVVSPDWNVLEGVTRRAVAEICGDEEIPFELRRVDPAELLDADEVLATTTAGGVMPIVALDGIPVGDGAPGPITRLLQQWYWARRAEGWNGTRVADVLAAARS